MVEKSLAENPPASHSRAKGKGGYIKPKTSVLAKTPADPNVRGVALQRAGGEVRGAEQGMGTTQQTLGPAHVLGTAGTLFLTSVDIL